MLLQVLPGPSFTLRSYLPSLRWAFTPQISSLYAPSPNMNAFRWGISSRSRLQIWNTSVSREPFGVTSEGTASGSFPLLIAVMAA